MAALFLPSLHAWCFDAVAASAPFGARVQRYRNGALDRAARFVYTAVRCALPSGAGHPLRGAGCPLIPIPQSGDAVQLVALLCLFAHLDLGFCRRLCVFWAVCLYFVHFCRDTLLLPRPSQVCNTVQQLAKDEDYGLPCSHSFSSVLLPGVLAIAVHTHYAVPWPAALVATLAWALAVALASAYLGHRSPADAAAGATLGACAVALWPIASAALSQWLTTPSASTAALIAALGVMFMLAYPVPVRSEAVSAVLASRALGMAVGVVLGGLLLSQGHPSPLRPCLAACGVTPQAPAPAPWFGGHGWTLKQHVALPACAVHSTTGLDTNQPQDPEVGPTAFYPPPNIALEAWRATHVVLGTSYARRQVQRAAGDVASAALRHAALPANGSAGQDARPSPPEQFPPLDTAALGRSLSAAVSPAVVASHLASAGRVADAATTTAMLERVATPVAAAAKASAGPCFPVARTARDGANQSTAVLPFLRIPPAAAAGDSGTLCFVGLSRAALARAQRGIRGAVAKEAALAADGAGLTLPDTTGATSPFSAFAAAAGDGAVPWADANTLALAPAGSAAAMACLLGAVGRVLGSLAALWTASAAFTRAEARWPRLRSLLPLPLPPAARAMQALSRVQGAGSDHHLAYERVLVTAASTARARQEELERRAGSCRAEARTLVQQARSARCKHDGSAAALLHRAQRAAAQSRELASAAGSVDVPALPFAEDMPRAFVRHVVYGAVASSVVPAAADAVARLVPAFA